MRFADSRRGRLPKETSTEEARWPPLPAQPAQTAESLRRRPCSLCVKSTPSHLRLSAAREAAAEFLGKASIGVGVGRVQQQVNQIEARKERRRQVDVLDDCALSVVPERPFKKKLSFLSVSVASFKGGEAA